MLNYYIREYIKSIQEKSQGSSRSENERKCHVKEEISQIYLKRMNHLSLSNPNSNTSMSLYCEFHSLSSYEITIP
jgi:hypothetical protein